MSVVADPLQVERCNYFLHACVETAQRKEAVDGRLVQFLLSNPTNDGGQWDMLVNLIGQSSSSAVLLGGRAKTRRWLSDAFTQPSVCQRLRYSNCCRQQRETEG